MYDNLLFAESLLIERVAAAVPELKSVGAWTELPETVEAVGPTPAAFVVFEGGASGGKAGGVAVLPKQYWTVAVLIRNGQSQADKRANREQAGLLLGKIFKALQGHRFDGCKPLELEHGPDARYYSGQALFYLTFALESPLLAR